MENRFLGNISASSIKSFFPKSALRKPKTMMKSRKRLNSNNENVPPIDPNIQISDPPLLPLSSFPKFISPTKPGVIHHEATRSETESIVPAATDSNVKVVVRIRPSLGLENGECIVKKVSDHSVSVGNREFSVDSVFDASATQEDVFQIVGVPAVNDALAGHNSSILAYGQTGSGKTYTMWGPPNALVGTQSANDQGIVPRIFEQLFAKIEQEKQNTKGRQIDYHCRCSFLEIHNGQIRDLLDSTHRNLGVKGDDYNGFYIEKLTEEYVTSHEDVIQIVIKGLSSRKVEAVSTNSKGSRSHVIFTCIIDFWCKEPSSKRLGSCRTSKISLVDLVGFESNALGSVGEQSLEGGNCVKNLINALVKKGQLDISEGVPSGMSCLSQLLEESLGGSAKLSIICAIIPDKKYLTVYLKFANETESTLTFGKQVKLVKNELVVNGTTEDNDLPNQIRHLKEELIREKNSRESVSVRSNHGFSDGQSIRESLNQLRLGLSRSLILTSVDDKTEVAASADENDLKELQVQMHRLHSSNDENFKDTQCCFTDLTSEQYVSCSEESEDEEIKSEATLSQFSDLQGVSAMDDHEDKGSTVLATRNNIVTSGRSPSEVLLEPVLSESPKIKKTNRKSMNNISPGSLGQQNDAQEITRSCKFAGQSIQHDSHLRSSMRSSVKFDGSTESLAASLQRGLEIIDHHQRKSTLDRSSVSFSFGHLALRSSRTVDKANISSQLIPEEREVSDISSIYSLCRSCQQKEMIAPPTEVQDSLNARKFEVKSSIEKSNLKPKNADTASEQLMEKEKGLEIVCQEQAAKIDELNQQLIRYKLELQQYSRLEHGNDAKCEGDKNSLSNENKNEKRFYNQKLLTWNGNENHDLEAIKEECEVEQQLQAQPKQAYNNPSVDESGKEDLLKEIAYLRSKLQLHNDGPTAKSTERIRSSLLAQSIQLRKSSAFAQGNSKEDIEKERQQWTEMESEWICLTDELRTDIESQRQRAEKLEVELRLEKKCTEELDDALKRSILGHATIVEQYAELQELYNGLVGKHHILLEAVAEVKRAAAKAAGKGRHGSRFAKSLAAELSAARVERDRESELLRKENNSLKTQLRDTAEAVHAAGELLVRLREAEETASFAEGNLTNIQEENDELKKQLEKLKRKHKMEITTMKQYLAESRLPQSALQPLYQENFDIAENNPAVSAEYDDQAWRAEFGAIYQEQHY